MLGSNFDSLINRLVEGLQKNTTHSANSFDLGRKMKGQQIPS